MSVAVNTILRYFIIAAVLTIGGQAAIASDDNRHTEGDIVKKCSDIMAGRHVNGAAEAIGRLCDRIPQNKFALMVNVLILKLLYDRSHTEERDLAARSPNAGGTKLLKVSEK